MLITTFDKKLDEPRTVPSEVLLKFSLLEHLANHHLVLIFHVNVEETRIFEGVSHYLLLYGVALTLLHCNATFTLLQKELKHSVVSRLHRQKYRGLALQVRPAEIEEHVVILRCVSAVLVR